MELVSLIVYEVETGGIKDVVFTYLGTVVDSGRIKSSILVEPKV